MPLRADRPFGEEVLRLLGARGISLRQLARLAEVSPGHLSRVLRSADQKVLTADLRNRVSAVLELPRGYFIEEREDAVMEALRADPAFRDELYDQVMLGEPRARSSVRKKRDRGA